MRSQVNLQAWPAKLVVTVIEKGALPFIEKSEEKDRNSRTNRTENHIHISISHHYQHKNENCSFGFDW